MRGKPTHPWILLALVLFCAGAGLFVLYAFTPGLSAFYPPCVFNTVTGYHCPGCGTARGLHRLVHGDIRGALAMNAFTMLALPFIIYSITAEVLKSLYSRPVLPLPRMPARAGWILFAAIMLFWILRNAPIYPFTLLAPH
jgi:hypothetical protein